jgi:hypothetical protein
MSEGNPSEIDKSLALSATRDKFGKPSGDEVKLVMELLHPRFEFLLNSEFFSIDAGNLGIFTEVKKESEKVTMSRPRLCAASVRQYIDKRCADRIVAAQKAEKGNNFRYFFDFKAGVDMELSSIPKAENEISNPSINDKIRLDVLHSANVTDQAGEEAEAYLKLKEMEAEYPILLRKDSSGFLLLDHVVKKIEAKDSKFIDPNWSREYVIAGAKTASNFYKKLYATVEPLYPKQQPK